MIYILWAAGWVVGLKYWTARNNSMSLSDMCLTRYCTPRRKYCFCGLHGAVSTICQTLKNAGIFFAMRRT